MAKQLAELIKKVDPTVVAAARAKADQEVFELRLAQLRQTVEMSQHDLAVALGISQPSVANLEKRGHEVKISSLKRYIEALGGKLSLDHKTQRDQQIAIRQAADAVHVRPVIDRFLMRCRVAKVDLTVIFTVAGLHLFGVQSLWRQPGQFSDGGGEFTGIDMLHQFARKIEAQQQVGLGGTDP